MERHPKRQPGLRAHPHRHPFLVVVADTRPDGSPGELAAFITNGGQGINFRKATWHHSLLALAGGDFLVVDRDGQEEDNCDITALDTEYVITMPIEG